ncbi:MAG: type VI secretion system baseplate subunit TssG [Proteobacteria bacterium]|nr:type VI secretion system baseplate subunit TssG [Pseudomonadota bacterium]
MARTNRKSAPTVKDVLLKEPYRFEFHQAIKLLEYLHPKAIPFGETVNPSEEVVSVKSRIYFESLSSDIYSLQNVPLSSASPPYDPPILNVNFMGLAGIQGPLPFPYTEMIIQRVRSGDTSLKDFLDIFNHRLISILHRIRKQYLICLNSYSPEKTEIAQGLKSLLGIGQPALQNRLHFPDRSLLDYAGLYWARPRSAEGLERIIGSYFNIPIRLDKCVGRWHFLASDQTTKLSKQGQWQALGQGAVLGTRAWDQVTHFSIHLGPLTVDQLDVFLPNGQGFPRLKDLTQLYADPSLDFSVTYQVEKPPSTQLAQKSYLGWRCWLGESLVSGDNVKVGVNNPSVKN